MIIERTLEEILAAECGGTPSDYEVVGRRPATITLDTDRPAFVVGNPELRQQ